MTNQDHLPLAPRDLLILAVLAEGPHHGYGIIKAVEARSESGVLLDPANLYRVLRRMRRLGWIEETAGGVDAPDTGPDSTPRRRTYALAPQGRALLSAELARLERLLMHVGPAVAGGEGS
jgi:DNA-binding PadR family transcriptional regulator